MKYKAILLDLDNTLYDYQSTHSIALEETLNLVHTQTKISKQDLQESYNKNRKDIHNSLHGLAASHSRLLYFQRIFEQYELGYKSLPLVHSFYWNSFINNIIVFEGVEDFFNEYYENTKICIVTDLTAEIQFQKLIHTKLLDKIHSVVTSEEAGREKPHPYIFHLALEKVNTVKEKVIYIGDDFEKDVIGSTSFGIDCIWLNRKEKKVSLPSRCKEVNEFKKIFELLDL